MHWRERYTYESGRAAGRLSKLSEEALIKRIESNQLDPYFAIWRTIARTGTIEHSAMVLWRFLQRSPGKSMMLHRYHCAAALFRLLGMDDPASKSDLRKAVQWDHKGEQARQQALLTLKDIIEDKQGHTRRQPTPEERPPPRPSLTPSPRP